MKSAGPDDVQSRTEVKFRPARFEDLPDVVSILTEAARWAKSRGIERWWSVPFPSEWVRRGIEEGEVVVVEQRSRIVGTLTLSRQDAKMWGEQPPIAGYVHRMAIRRELAGQGPGGRLLNWAEGEARRWGRTKLRLDCLATNESLVRYYRGQGFREIGRVRGNIPGEERASVLMERDVSESPSVGGTPRP